MSPASLVMVNDNGIMNELSLVMVHDSIFIGNGTCTFVHVPSFMNDIHIHHAFSTYKHHAFIASVGPYKRRSPCNV